MHAAEARAAGVGMTGTLGHLALLVSLATPPHHTGEVRCERAFCRCIPPARASVEQIVHGQRERAAQVVLGRVVRVDSLAPRLAEHGPNQVAVYDLAARVAVSRVWKGPVVDTMTVVFGSTPIASSCDLTLLTGSSYVIFAVAYDDGVLRTRQCTGTAAEAEATATISALGRSQEPKQ
jgi:hypothetical protein